jgi:hypothetical protein
MKSFRSFTLALTLFAGCAEDVERSATSASGGIAQPEVCDRYLDCIAVASPGALPDSIDAYGSDGTCWRSDEQANRCRTACEEGLAQLAEAAPDEAACHAGVGGAGGAGPTCAQPGILDGAWYATVSMYLAPAKPFVFAASLTSAASPSERGFSMSLQPLSAADRVTPVGPPIDGGPFAMSESGAFDAALETFTIVGEANPINGTDIVMNATLHGVACSNDPDFFCGSVSGDVTKPVPVTLDPMKNNFTFQRLRFGSASLEPLIDCEKSPADPL